ncbi:MAG: phosphotransferase [Patescibacteria group bacterium]|nr:phosphotransferase [Patescibacteria group bacterium]
MPTQADENKKYAFDRAETGAFLKKHYGLVPKQYVRITSGIINTSVKIRTEDAEYVLRIYQKEKSAKEIERELAVIAVMARNGIPVASATPGLNRRKIQTLETRNGSAHPAVLFPFLEGQHTGPDQKNLIPQIAEIQGMMHRIGEKELPARYTRSIAELMKLLDDERTSAQGKLRTHPDIGNILEHDYKMLRKEYEGKQNAIGKLPFALCHLDYDSSNILNDGTAVTGVIDFDDIAPVPPILDVGFSLWWWCYHNPDDRLNVAKLYLVSYNRARKISDAERDMLPLFMRIRNLTLAYLLFVNIPQRPSLQSLRKSAEFEEWLQKTKL